IERGIEARAVVGGEIRRAVHEAEADDELALGGPGETRQDEQGQGRDRGNETLHRGRSRASSRPPWPDARRRKLGRASAPVNDRARGGEHSSSSPPAGLS